MRFTSLCLLVFLFGSALCEAGVPFFVRTGTGSYIRMRWPNPAITLQVNAATASSLSNAQVLSQIQIATSQWQSVPEASVSFTILTTSTSPTALGGEPDRVNFISFGSGTQFNPGVIAITFTTARNDNGEIVDADMMFNKQDYVFVDQVADSNPSANRILLSGVATHEFGHLLGFDHSPIREQTIKNALIPESTMFPYYSDAQLSLEADDKSMLAFTYPSGSNTFQGFVQGQILSGAVAGEAINGAHVVIWDIEDRTKVYSTISGITASGINFDGRYEVFAVPRGNYEAFIEPFPIPAPKYTNTQVRLENDFVFLNAVPDILKQGFLNRVRSFPLEFWHNLSESGIETSSGVDSAATFFLPPQGRQSVNFVTNQGTANLNLSGSQLLLETRNLYPNGLSNGEDRNQSWTVGNLFVKNSLQQHLDSDLGDRMRLRLSAATPADYNQFNLSARSTLCQTVSQPSFSRTTLLTSVQPTFVQSSPPFYTFEVYAPNRDSSVDTCVSKLTMEVKGSNDTFDPVVSELLYISKANTDQTSIGFIPDIRFLLKLAGRQVFGDANRAYSAPGTFRIEPKFPDGSAIQAPIPVTTSNTFAIAQSDRGNTIVTSPLERLSPSGPVQLQTTMAFAGRDLTQATFTVDGVRLPVQPEISFESISGVGSQFLLSQGTVHIAFPGVVTAAAEVRIFPNFEDQSPVPFLFQSTDFNVILTSSSGTLFGSPATGPFVIMGDGVIDPFPSPRRSSTINYLGNPFYRSTIPAQPGVGTYTVRVSVVDVPLSQTALLRFDNANAVLTEVVADKKFIAMNSGDRALIEVIPRFSDNTRVNADISGLIQLSSSSSDGCHDTFSNLTNGVQSTSLLNPGINPSVLSTGSSIRLTAELVSRITGQNTTSCTIRIGGRINAGGFQDIGISSQVQLVDINENRLQIQLDATTIPADGISQTRLIITPFFPDGQPMGPNLDSQRIKVSISHGELLRKTEIVGGGELVLRPFGRDGVSVFNNRDGTYELSIRSSNFSTRALLTFYVDDRLSLISREIEFSKVGSADPDKTVIQILNPILYADGISNTRIDIFPRTTANEPLFLPATSIVSVSSAVGALSGAITSNSDGSWTQWIRSQPTTTKLTGEVTVSIDGIRMQPDTAFVLTMLNVDATRLTSDFVFPETARVDAFDVAIISRHIRTGACTTLQRQNCTLDFNGDGVVNESDLTILLRAYGQSALR